MYELLWMGQVLAVFGTWEEAWAHTDATANALDQEWIDTWG